MPYDTPTVKQVDRQRVHIEFSDSTEQLKPIGRDFPLSGDVKAQARAFLAELNTVEEKPKYSEGQVLDLTPPTPTPDQIAEAAYQADLQLMERYLRKIAMGILSSDDAKVEAVRARLVAAESTK